MESVHKSFLLIVAIFLIVFQSTTTTTQGTRELLEKKEVHDEHIRVAVKDQKGGVVTEGHEDGKYGGGYGHGYGSGSGGGGGGGGGSGSKGQGDGRHGKGEVEGTLYPVYLYFNKRK
ncbi:unnamed protein product [Lactuca virosa]|uniref:Glycine-rich protein n=1 Tax=Lactuca virosa TaxID=75947 RepID=A0AAU9MVR5_9ASTR|nr:unnamed protein product [Lactuca virosa]